MKGAGPTAKPTHGGTAASQPLSVIKTKKAKFASKY